MSKAIVSVVKCEGHDIERAVDKAVDLIGGLEDVKGKRVISIKPNLSTPKSSASGATTAPEIVEALIKKVRSINPCEIRIVETNNSKATADKTFEYLGFKDLAERYDNVRCVNLSKDEKIRVKLDGNIFSSLLVPESMLFSDYLISVAKMKTHVDYVYTGALKNQFGFLLGPRARYHGVMSKVLVDLNRFYRPDLTVIDGLPGMEGFGPTDGSPKFAGVIIASRDMVAADTVASRIMGLDPSRISYLGYAQKKELCNSETIQLVGAKLSEVATDFEFIPSKYFFIGRFSLLLEKMARYLENLATLMRLSRSALSTIEFSTLEQRLSYGGLFKLAKDTISKVDD
jgi:uncharacterized protein (DUF362 family)